VNVGDGEQTIPAPAEELDDGLVDLGRLGKHREVSGRGSQGSWLRPETWDLVSAESASILRSGPTER
jgi:hypothetical protein